MNLFLQGTVAVVGQTGPVGHVGPVPIYLFGITTALGVIVGLAVALVQTDRAGLSLSKTFEYAPWGVIAGVLGARFGYVFVHLGDYVRASGSVMKWSEGGFLFHGALLGGVVALLVYARIVSLDVWRVLDAFAPGLALGQAVGLVGAHVLGQGTSVPWGVVVQETIIHPLPAYGIILAYGLFLMLWRLGAGNVRPGGLFLTYALLHGVGSIFLGIWSSARTHWGMTPTQWGGLLTVVAAVVFMYIRRGMPIEPFVAPEATQADVESFAMRRPRTIGARAIVAVLWMSGLLVLLAGFSARIG